MPPVYVDVAIIGGGMVGASLAVALADSGLATMLVEGVAPGSDSQPSFDDRTTALGNASRRIFQALGVWERIAPEAAAIRAIHVSDAGRFGFARLDAGEQGIDALGYVVPNRVIGAALWNKLQQANGVLLRVPARPEDLRIGPESVTFNLTTDAASRPPVQDEAAGHNLVSGQQEPVSGQQEAAPAGGREAVSARLVVAADGANSPVRTAAGIEAAVEDYDQIAIVANVAADRPNDGTAYERFTESGPLAVLPLRDGSYGVIWTCTPARATGVLSFDDDRYLHELQDRFGWRAGRFTRAGVRSRYPLKLTRAAATVAQRTVLIGNAAQALHPVAGQGFNLGLRDAAMLAEVLVGAMPSREPSHNESSRTEPSRNQPLRDEPPRDNGQCDVGSPALLRQFADWRAGDRAGVVRFTDGLVKLFADARPGIGLMRNLALLLFDITPPAKSALARVSAGFAGPTPRLARGLRLRP